MNVELSYHPHPAQLEIHKNRSRFRVVVCGRRFGKTTLAANELIVAALKYPGSLNWYVAPTYRQAKQIAWEILQKYCPAEAVAKKNEAELSLTLYNGSKIELKGADSPDSLRGVGVNFLVVDEVASIRNWDWLWQEVLRPTLTDVAGRAIFISTPKGFNHLYNLYLKRWSKDGPEDPDIASWVFKSSANPYLPKEELEKAKQELSPDYYAQEYEADFRKYTGLVYRDFSRETHVIAPFEIPQEWEIARSMDFGFTNPTVCLWIAIDHDDNWFIFHEYYEVGKHLDYVAGVINSHPLSRRVSVTFGDPSGAQEISDFSQRGIYITPATKDVGTSSLNWVRFKIEKVTEQLKKQYGHSLILPLDPPRYIPDAPRLFVFSNCLNTIREFETYRWRENAEGAVSDLNNPDQPEKANDHAMDALGYFAVSFKRMPDLDPLTINPPAEDAKWRIGE